MARDVGYRGRCGGVLAGVLGVLQLLAGTGGGRVVGAERNVLIGVLVAGVDVAPSDEAAARRQQQLREDAGDRVFFGEESAELGAHARRVLAGQVDWLRRHPTSVLCIEGHADERGDGARNLALSLQRAEKVRARLIESGVEEERLTVRALGNSRPVAICAEELCRAQNRRAVSIVAHRAAFDRAAMSISASNSGSRR